MPVHSYARPLAKRFRTCNSARDFTRRNTTFMTWNLMHFARKLKDAGGIPAWGNTVDLWKEGYRFDAPNPEYR